MHLRTKETTGIMSWLHLTLCSFPSFCKGRRRRFLSIYEPKGKPKEKEEKRNKEGERSKGRKREEKEQKKTYGKK